MRKRKNGRERRVGLCAGDTDTGTDMESNLSDESMAKNGVATCNSQVRVRIDTFRVRLADSDGCSVKAILDAIVHCGILRDDSTKEIKEPIEIVQHKVKCEDEERTEIRIKRV